MTQDVAPLAKTLLLAHTVSAAVLIGSSTHLSLQALNLIRGRPRPRLLAVYPPVALAAWCIVFALGAVMYPRYRIGVRANFLDANVPWAAILFDVKENLAVFVGPLLAGAWWMSRGIVNETDVTTRRWFAAACIAPCLISWWNALSGLLVTSIRSV
jgi:hypothetical protein